MKEFMFIYRSGDPSWRTKATAEARAAVMADWGTWLGALGQKGQLVSGGSPLEFDGKRLLKKDGVLTDIVASELKELVSGYSIVKAESYEHAATIARDCPVFHDPGATLEIRAVIAI